MIKQSKKQELNEALRVSIFVAYRVRQQGITAKHYNKALCIVNYFK